MGHEIGCSEFTMPNSCTCGATWTNDQLMDEIRELRLREEDLENHMAGVMITTGNLKWKDFIKWVEDKAGIIRD